MEVERAQAMASYMDQQGLWPCNGRPFMPLLVTAVAHKVRHNSLTCNRGSSNCLYVMTVPLDLLIVCVDSGCLHHALLRSDVHYDGACGSAACMC